jgi:hypothetical protein
MLRQYRFCVKKRIDLISEPDLEQLSGSVSDLSKMFLIRIDIAAEEVR